MWWRRQKPESHVFLDLLVRSGLLGTRSLSKACCGKDRYSLDRLCSHLVENGWLTDWQCNKIRDGKWKGFFLDKYKLLKYVASDPPSKTYIAEDMHTCKFVVLRITPPNSSGESTNHEVVDLPSD
jgi:serine/threonine-protein kinase